ncbi:Lipoprotein [Burkholderia orbicola]
MTIRIIRTLASLIVIPLVATACAPAATWNGVIAGTPRFRMTDEPCAIRCSARPDSEIFPVDHVRHGIEISTSGIATPQEISLVDLDAGTLSFVEFDVDWVNGKRRTTVVDIGDIVLGTDDLAQIGAITNSIWTSPAPVPTAQPGLDGFWYINVLNGANVRNEIGMGVIGGTGRLFSEALYRVQRTQTPYFFVQNRRRYLMWSCYPEASRGYTSAPALHLRTPGYSGSEIEDTPQSFPIPHTDPQRFRFYLESRWSTCADTGRVLAVLNR